MAVYAHDDVLDGGIDLVVDDANAVHLMDSFTSNYATVLSSSIGTFTPSISTVSITGGRGARMSAETDVSITANGTLNHYAIVDTSTSKVLLVSEADGKVFTNGDTVDIASADVYQVYDTVLAP